jgi:hypothetical protein
VRNLPFIFFLIIRESGCYSRCLIVVIISIFYVFLHFTNILYHFLSSFFRVFSIRVGLHHFIKVIFLIWFLLLRHRWESFKVLFIFHPHLFWVTHSFFFALNSWIGFVFFHRNVEHFHNFLSLNWSFPCFPILQLILYMSFKRLQWIRNITWELQWEQYFILLVLLIQWKLMHCVIYWTVIL